MLPNHLNWIEVDPQNLPKGIVLALGSDYDEGKVQAVGELYRSNSVKCDYTGTGEYAISNVTHYIPMSELPMPGDHLDDDYEWVHEPTEPDPAPTIEELKARAQDVADRFNKKYGLSPGSIVTILGLDVWDAAEVEVDDSPHSTYQVYVRILGSIGASRLWHYIYCADTDSFIDRFQGCLD